MKVIAEKNKFLGIRYIILLCLLVFFFVLSILGTLTNNVFLLFALLFLVMIVFQSVQLYKYNKAPKACISIDNDKKLHLYKDIILDPKDINYVYYEDTYVPKSIITDIGKVIIETSEKDYEYNYVDNILEVVSELKAIVIKAKGEEK